MMKIALTEVWDSLYYPISKLQQSTPIDLQEGAIIPFYKPLGWTSFDVVNKVRSSIRWEKKLKKVKVGHAGTLDPQATGVLVVCIGRATRKIEELMDHDKTYLASMKLGITTPSFDTELEPDRFYPYEHITREALEQACRQYEGDIEQIPPLYSAIQVEGRRAYDIARSGEEVQLPPKKVHIEKISIQNFSLPDVVLSVQCSRGTYIRALARDLGYSLNSGAYLTGLERVQSGKVYQEECLRVEDLSQLIPMIQIPQTP